MYEFMWLLQGRQGRHARGKLAWRVVVLIIQRQKKDHMNHKDETLVTYDIKEQILQETDSNNNNNNKWRQEQ